MDGIVGISIKCGVMAIVDITKSIWLDELVKL